MKKAIEWILPIKTVSEANSSEHWTKSGARHKLQRKIVKIKWIQSCPEISLPCEIKLTRISPRELDDDNLRTSLKYCRDEISNCIFPEKTFLVKTDGKKAYKSSGRGDSDKRISWSYAQEKGKPFQYAVKIEISY